MDTADFRVTFELQRCGKNCQNRPT